MKKDTKLILIVLAGILAIVLLCVFAVQGTQNRSIPHSLIFAFRKKGELI